jgi:Domain of unknown function (DUF4157)
MGEKISSQKKSSWSTKAQQTETPLFQRRPFSEPSLAQNDTDVTLDRNLTDTPDIQNKISSFNFNFLNIPSHAPSGSGAIQQKEEETEDSLADKDTGLQMQPDDGKQNRFNFEQIFLQPKLTVGAPNDAYEQEADRVADQVMNTPDAAIQAPIQREAAPEAEELQTKPLAAAITPLVQREMAPGEEEEQAKRAPELQREEMPEEEEIQTKPIASIQREEMPEEEEVQTKPLGGSIQREAMPEEEELQAKPLGNGTLQREAMPEEEEAVQAKGAPDAALPTGSNLESRLSSSQGGGSPLSEEVRTFMEPRFGADFSQVRVHTGSEAVQMNRDLNAQAFTHKQDVYFGAGKAPGKDALTAHELTHVVQQSDKIQMQTGEVQDDGSSDPTRQAIVSHAEADASDGGVHATQVGDPDETGKKTRPGWEWLLKYFHVAAPGIWSDKTIKYNSKKGYNGLPHWCGIFALWALRNSGVDVGTWKQGGGISSVKGMKPTQEPKVGDVGFISEPWQHHFIVSEVSSDGKTISSVDGNSGKDSEVTSGTTRSRSRVNGFYTAFSAQR